MQKIMVSKFCKIGYDQTQAAAKDAMNTALNALHQLSESVLFASCQFTVNRHFEVHMAKLRLDQLLVDRELAPAEIKHKH